MLQLTNEGEDADLRRGSFAIPSLLGGDAAALSAGVSRASLARAPSSMTCVPSLLLLSQSKSQGLDTGAGLVSGESRHWDEAGLARFLCSLFRRCCCLSSIGVNRRLFEPDREVPPPFDSRCVSIPYSPSASFNPAASSFALVPNEAGCAFPFRASLSPIPIKKAGRTADSLRFCWWFVSRPADIGVATLHDERIWASRF